MDSQGFWIILNPRHTQKPGKNPITRFQEKLLLDKEADKPKDKKLGRTVKTLKNFLWEHDVVFEIIIRYQCLNKFELVVAMLTD